jgi:hypothetical protein
LCRFLVFKLSFVSTSPHTTHYVHSLFMS